LAKRLTDQDETWQAGRPRPWSHCVRWRPSSPPPKGGKPQFLAHICCGQMAAGIKMPLGMEVGLGPGDFVLDGDPAPPSPKRGRSPSPQFSAHVHCGQTAGWIEMALDIEVGHGPGYIVLDWDPAPLPKKGAEPPPQFSAHFYCGQRLDESRCHSVWR